MLGTLKNSDVKRTLMSNAELHYEFNRYKLDTTFSQHINHTFLSSLFHA
jgi:hypothetical protein